MIRQMILVVEDHPVLGRQIIRVLESLGYSATLTNDTGEALALLTDPEPDALLVDAMLPSDLPVFLSEAKKRCPGCRVLVISGHDRRTLIREGRLPAGVAFLPKPFDIPELQSCLLSLFRGAA